MHRESSHAHEYKGTYIEHFASTFFLLITLTPELDPPPKTPRSSGSDPFRGRPEWADPTLVQPGPPEGFLANFAQAPCMNSESSTCCGGDGREETAVLPWPYVPNISLISEAWKTPASGNVCRFGKVALNLKVSSAGLMWRGKMKKMLT